MSMDGQSRLRALEARLAREAARYFPELAGEPVRVARAWSLRRKFSELHRFELTAGCRRYAVVAKIPVVPPRLGRFDRRDSDGEPPEAVDRLELLTHECEALRKIHEHFSGIADPRFGSVEVLDLWPEQHLLLMRALDEPMLHKQLRARTTALEEKLRNAGAWLRHFHALPRVNAEVVRMPTRAAFLDAVERSSAILAGVAPARTLRFCLQRSAAAAGELMPERLPLAVAHTDYAPHNIFVGPDGAVTVIDTLANRRTPGYRDLAYFLLRLKSTGIRFYGPGLPLSRAHSARYEACFLQGYYAAEPVPWSLIRLFEVEAVLREWAQTALSQRRAAGVWRLAKALRARFRGAHYSALLERLSAELG